MKAPRLWMLPVLFLLVCGMIGCGEKSAPVVGKRKAAVAKPKAASAEPKVTDKLKPAPKQPETVGSGPASGPNAAEKPKSALGEAFAAQRECSQRLGLPVRIMNSIGMKLALIPAGEFMMGSTESDDDVPPWEKPQHRVRITKPFYLGVCEVTQVEYEKVMGKKPSYFKGAGNPVEQVSWNGAMEFCKVLSAMDGKTYRLPTEAEWEYACRAGTTTRYSSGDDSSSLERYAWFHGNKTYPVGTKRPNAWGLNDMHGNAGEWCADWWDENFYAVSPTDDPPGPETGSLRVIRGGGWKDTAGDCRAANRGGFVPAGRLHHLGFRVAAVPPVTQGDGFPRPKAERVRQPPRRR